MENQNVGSLANGESESLIESHDNHRDEKESSVDMVLSDSNEMEQHEFEEQRRNERLRLNDLFQAAYNNGNFIELQEILQKYCDEKIRYSTMGAEVFGILPILTFFMICNEIFPDSFFKTIAKRVASYKQSTPPVSPNSIPGFPPPPVTTEMVEFIGKFTGTKVIDKTIPEVFGYFCASGILRRPLLTVPQITEVLHGYFYASGNVPSCADEKVYSIISESILTFNLQTNKIIDWSYKVVAHSAAPK